MRPPRSLLLLLLLAVLLAGGAWMLVRTKPAIDASEIAEAPAPALAAPKSESAPLESNSVAVRTAEPQAAPALPGKHAPIPLANSTRIRGRLVRGAGELPVAGITVRCAKQVPRESPPTRLVREDGSRILFDGMDAETPAPAAGAVSGADGSFEFTDLDRGALYALTARGIGWSLVAPLTDVAPSEEPVTLALRRVYVARVSAVDENGEPPPGECEYLRYARIAAEGECDSVPLRDSVYHAIHEIQLPPGIGEPPRPSSRSYTFASDCDQARLGPFRALVCSPGFEREDFEFWAFPEEVQAQPTLFRLRRAAASTGMLRVHQDCECSDAVCAHLLEGRLVLEPADGGAQPLEFELTGLVREQVFANIPGGSWRARVVAKAGGYSYPAAQLPPAELVIGSEPALLHVPVEKLGAIRWKLRGPGEELAAEGLPLRFGEGASQTSVELWMSVVMRGVEGGTQEFEFAAARCASVEGASCSVGPVNARVLVEVKPGQTQTVVVHTP